MIDVPERVKDALRSGAHHIEYTFKVYDDDGKQIMFIDNTRLIKESVVFKEQMCSTDVLKYGLCEGSSIEFQYYGLDSIQGRKVEAKIVCEYENEHGVLWTYSIPIGWFTVKQCAVQPRTGIRKAVCYNSLYGGYLDEDITDRIKLLPTEGDGNVVSVYTVLSTLLQDYYIETEEHESSEIEPINIDSDEMLTEIFEDVYTSYHGTCHVKFYGYNYRFKISPNTRVLIKAKNYIDFYKEMFPSFKRQLLSDLEWNLGNPDVAREFYNRNFKDIAASHNLPFIYAFEPQGTVQTQYTMDGCPVSEGVVNGGDIENLSTMPAKNGDAYINIPFIHRIVYESIDDHKQYDGTVFEYDIYKLMDCFSKIEILAVETSSIEEMLIDRDKVNGLTLRQLQSASLELEAKFGRIDRVSNKFYAKSLVEFGLMPREGRTPSESLRPNGYIEHTQYSQYYDLWTDDHIEKSFKELVINYKTYDEDGNVVQKEIHWNLGNGNTVYTVQNNWLIDNLVFTDEQIEQICDDMAYEMNFARWIPYEMWLTGMPYIEVGDVIDMTIDGHNYQSYVLARTLKGIQKLQDTFKAETLNVF